MKSIMLKIVAAGIMIEVIENPILSSPWPDDKGKMSYWGFASTEDNRLYVHNIYTYFFGIFGISEAAKISCFVAKNHIYSLIDNMVSQCVS